MLNAKMLESHELRGLGISCGDGCLVHSTCVLVHPEKLTIDHNVRIDAFTVISGEVRIERNSHISSHCMLMAGRERISMGVNTNMSAGSKIYAESDDLSGRGLIGPCVHESTRHIHRGYVVMDDYTCLGPNAIMMPNSYLAWGSNLMSHSILLGGTDPESIYQGVPAKKIKDRLPNWKKHVQSFRTLRKTRPEARQQCGELHGHD